MKRIGFIGQERLKIVQNLKMVDETMSFDDSDDPKARGAISSHSGGCTS